MNLLRKAERLATIYDKEDGYFLAFSGGKDSQCLYHIAQIAGVNFKAHMNLTSVDPPEVIRFVKQHYPGVELAKPKRSIYQTAVEKKILPTMRVRWCCEEYKENAGAGKVTLIGIRHAESSRRAKRNEVEISSRKYSGTLEGLDAYRSEQQKKRKQKEVNITNATDERTLGCIHGKESLLISPIIHWTEDDVWQFLNRLEIPHCSLYDKGYKRIGCICCPMSNYANKLREIERWPHVKRNWIKAIKAIRNGGGYLETNISGGTSKKTSSLFAMPTNGHRWGRIYGNPDPKFFIARKWLQTDQQWSLGGFSDGSSSDGLTDEQRENEIAEQIFDWWISGKGYKRWFAEKHLQQKLNFEE